MTIYVNGAFSGASTNIVDSNTIVTNRKFNYFGRRYDLLNNGQYGIANLLLDEIKLYKIALTQEQIVQDMNSVSGIPVGICDTA
jgi:hypothetical protein